MNSYQKEQLETLLMIRKQLERFSASEIEYLRAEIAEYLSFRSGIADFLEHYFKDICTEKCYESQLSACCSKDGIIAFFADAVINALVSNNHELDCLENVIRRPDYDHKCIFLSKNGCLWRIKPIVCEMFLCDEAERTSFGVNQDALKQWNEFKEIKKDFTWPDKPVLFEHLEKVFMGNGCKSPLMYIHYSPGLLRIKTRRDEKGKKSAGEIGLGRENRDGSLKAED